MDQLSGQANPTYQIIQRTSNQFNSDYDQNIVFAAGRAPVTCSVAGHAGCLPRRRRLFCLCREFDIN